MLPQSLVTFQNRTKNPVLRVLSRPLRADAMNAIKHHTMYDQLITTLRSKGGLGLAAPQVAIHKRVFIVERRLFNEMPTRPRAWKWTTPPPPPTAAGTTATAAPTAAVNNSTRVQPPPPHLFAPTKAESGSVAAPSVASSLPATASAHDREYAVIINPTIEAVSTESSSDWEGCLSIPGFVGCVRRPAAIRVSYYTRTPLDADAAADMKEKAAASAGAGSAAAGADSVSLSYRIERVESATLTHEIARTFAHESDHLNGILFVDHLTSGGPESWLTHAEFNAKFNPPKAQSSGNRFFGFRGI